MSVELSDEIIARKTPTTKCAQACPCRFQVLSQSSPYHSERRAGDEYNWKQLTLAVLILIIVIVVASIIFSYLNSQTGRIEHREHYCGNKPCVHPDWLTSSLNQSVDPCHDFGAHVCSTWKPSSQLIAWNVQHDPKYAWTRNKSKYLLRKLFSAKGMKHIAEVYNSCINRTAEDQRETLAEFVSFMNSHILRAQQGHEVVNLLDVALELSIRWQMPFWFDVRLLEEAPSRGRRIYLSPSRYPSFWRSMYKEFSDERTYKKFIAAFRQIFTKYNVSGANYTETNFSVAADIMASIYRASYRRDKRPAVLPLGYLEGLLPAGESDSWTSLLNKNLRPTPAFTHHDVVLVSDTEILEVLKRLLLAHGWKNMLDQLVWWFVQAYTVVASDDAFVAKYGDKATADVMKPMFCEIQVEVAYKLPLLIDHVSSYFDSGDRKAIDSLLESVILAAVAKINECDWMDGKSKAAAIAKVNTIFVNIWPRNNILKELFTLSPGRRKEQSYIRYWIRGHEQSASQIGTAAYYEEIRVAHNFRDDTFHYDYLVNNVTLALLALEEPFYDPRGTVAFRYGALGSAFARQVVMAFDLEGINYLPNGTKHMWLSPDSNATFLQKATCDGQGSREIIFPVIPGLEVAFRAFQDASRSPADSSQELPSLEDRKMFFLAFCHVMCVLDTTAFGDGCNLALKQFRPFAETFGCRQGSQMNPTRKCVFFNDM